MTARALEAEGELEIRNWSGDWRWRPHRCASWVEHVVLSETVGSNSIGSLYGPLPAYVEVAGAIDVFRMFGNEMAAKVRGSNQSPYGSNAHGATVTQGGDLRIQIQWGTKVLKVKVTNLGNGKWARCAEGKG